MSQTPDNPNTLFGMDIGVDISGLTKKFNTLRKQVSKRNLLIEFGKDSLNYAEAKFIEDQISFNKLDNIEIDETALDKGVPTDPKQMGIFLSELLSETKIWAHRVAILLPPEASLSSVIYLPAELSLEGARKYLLNSQSS